MTEALYLKDQLMKECDAKVLDVKDGKYVILDKTVFYPNGGGQPHDTGNFVRKSDGKEFKVIFTGKFSGEISHEVSELGLEVGDEILAIIDWERRYTLMRYHTAAHIISGMFSKELLAKITGNQLNEDKGRIDFDLENLDREVIAEMILKCNSLIAEDRKVSAYEMAREEVEKSPEMVKLATGLPKGIDVLRIVDIDGFDRQPDGGTHVASLKEVGTIVLTKLENKGKSNRRLYFTLEA